MKQPLRVLSLEDNPMDAELVHAALRAGWPDCEVVRVETREAFRAALARGGFDLILSDNTLPTFTGREALMIARTEYPAIPFIYVSGTIGEEAAIESLREGALDYVLKHRLGALVPAVQRVLREAEARAARREAEEALRRREEHYRSLTENALDLITLLGPDGCFLYQSSSIHRVLGYTPEELLGQCAFESVHPHDLPSVQAAFDEAVQDPGKAVTVEFRFRHRDGTWRHLEAIGKSMLDVPDVAGVVVNSRDATERKRAVEALQESERRYRDLVDNALVGVYRTTVNGRWLYANEALAFMLGFDTVGALLATDAKDRYARPEQRNALIARLQELGKVHNLELDLLTRSGQARNVLVSATLLGDTLSGMVIDITSRKRAEAALSDSQMRFQSVWRHSPDGLRLTDEQGIMVEVNEAYCRLTGMKAEELHGQPFTVSYAGRRDPAEMQEKYRRRFAERKIDHHLVRRVTYRSGRTAEVEVSTAFLESPGQQALLLSIFHDISERKAAEDALRASEEQVRRLIDSSLDMIIAVDNDRRITLFNSAAESVFGYGKQEALGQPVDLLYADPEEGQRVHETTVSNGKCLREIVNQRKNGDRFPSLLAASVLREADGQLAGVMGISRDITEQKRAEQRIRDQAELLDKARDAILVCDMERRILYWNDSAERLYGWTAAESVGQDAAKLLFATATESQPAEKQLLENGEWKGEVTQRTKSGGTITVESHLTLVRDEAGRPKAKLVINTDITGKKELEAQFLRAQRLESIGMLASGIAHDLNNVLAPIMMSVTLLRDQLKEGNGAEILSTLDASARRGAGLVQQILAFARGREGERQAIQLSHLIAEFAKVIRDTFPKSIHFQRKVAPDLWLVEANPTQMHQVLLNLCVNARDAMPQGGRLTVTAKNLRVDELQAQSLAGLSPGAYVLVQVADTGTGIPQDIRDKIFLPFFTTKAEGHGTGLGLASVLGIVKNHGGVLTVDSQVGQGATFSVYLPATMVTVASGTVEAAPPLSGGNGETILMAEDESGVREVIVRSLSRHGYRVLTANDGAEAMAVFAQNAADIKLVLTDVNMPYMDGASLIRAVRKLAPGMKLLVMTGLADNFDSVQFSSGRPITVLHKPFDSKSLLSSVHEALHQPA